MRRRFITITVSFHRFSLLRTICTKTNTRLRRVTEMSATRVRRINLHGRINNNNNNNNRRLGVFDRIQVCLFYLFKQFVRFTCISQ